MHQGSALSPLLFVMVMEALSREFRVALPWKLLYADDLVVIAETEEDLINEWKHFVENRIRTGWNKFRQLVPLLTNEDTSLKVRGRLYSSCVRSSMLHGSTSLRDGGSAKLSETGHCGISFSTV